MIPITLNGEARELPDGSTLADLVAQVAQAPTALATAINGDFVPRGERSQRVLQANDAVFTFQPITGG